MGRVKQHSTGRTKVEHLPDGAECAYCSGMAVRWNRVIAKANWFVPGCLECDKMLDRCAFSSIPMRAKWLHRQYRKRFGKIMAGAYWDEAEIAELTGGFKALVMEAKSAQAELDHRLARLRIVAGFCWDYLRPSG